MIYNCYLTCALLPFLVSAISGFIFTPQIISFCLKRKLYDLPNERKVHHSAIPRLGGVAFLPCMLLAFLVAMLVLSIVFTDRKAAAEEQRRQDEEMIRKERNKMRAAFEFDDEDDDKPESDNKTDGE